MTNTTKQGSLRAFWLILLVALWSLGLKAQIGSNPVLTWDKEVGCIDKRNDKGDRDNYTLYEYISYGICLRVCENSYVKYTFSDNNIAQVEWEVSGGQLYSSSNTNANILWGAFGNGSLTLNITYTNNTTTSLTLCVEKIASPKALFQVDGIEPNQTDFCTNMPISFDNLSTDNNGSEIIDYFWDFGDGNTSNTFEPVHRYEQEGEYTVELKVTNSCNCTTIYKKKFRIKGKLSFEISCPSVVCEGSVETYSVTDRCGGDWKVIGGHIVHRTETTIDVKWDAVDPAEGFGYVSYRSNCSCPYWTTVKIPVILREAKIKGPGMVCQGSQALFTLPQWPTTEFKWMINGNPNHHMLVRTDQRNEIIVDGTTAGDYELSVEYVNTLIDDGSCKGIAKYKFRVGEKPHIITDPSLTICPGTNKSFSLNSGTSAQWIVELNGTTIHTVYGNSLYYDFPNSGTHIVTADYDGCNTNPILVEVVENEAITGEIKGPEKVCLNTPYTYKITENQPGYIYVWSVTNGSIIGTNAGQQVDIQFTGAGTVSVVKQFVKNGVTCSSAPIDLKVIEAKLNPIIINDSGLTKFCPSSRTTFSLDLNGIVPDHIAWSFVSNQSHFGNIIDGINSEVVTVSFNEISNNNVNGVLKAEITKCGRVYTKTYNIVLINTPTLTLAPLGNICPGNDTLTIQLSSNEPIAGKFVTVSFDGLTPIGPFQVPANGILTIPNEFDNNSPTNIARTITVYLDICQYKVQTSQNVTVFPLTRVDISPNYNYTVCPSNPSVTTIYATVSTGITTSVEFKWYRNNIYLAGFDGPTFRIGENNHFGGIYHLLVKDINGCIVKSKDITVTESCGGSPGGGSCTITPDPNVRFQTSWSACDVITAHVDYDSIPDSISWTWSTHLTIDPATQGTPDPVFTTNVPGVHTISGTLKYGNCLIYRKLEVKKHYDPILKTAITCNGNGTFNVVLHNSSRIFEINATDITYTYTGPNGFSASNQTGNSVTVPNVVPGQYTYYLTLSAPGKPNCVVSVPVNIETEPNANFTLSPLRYCADDKVILTLAAYNPSYRYKWIFNNTSYIATSTETEIQFPIKGNYLIELEITTPYGCTYRSTNNVQIQINKSDFNQGTILPALADFCESNPTPLSFAPSTPIESNLTSILWMLGNQEVGQGLTYQPTQSGSYWPVLIDQNGCKSYIMSSNPKNYVLRQPPFASINGNTSVCYNENTTLTGITTDNNVQFRWTGYQIPAALGNWSSNGANKTLPLNGLAPGSYEFTFHTRIANDNSCVNSFTVIVTVHPEVTRPTISYTLLNCQPYTLRLTATGPTTGTYNWSNGMSGQSIEVHLGGAYSVTYTETTGCSQIASIQTPHNPERSLWVVPQGCYTVCKAYLLGPLGVYQNYEWQHNATTTQSGNNAFIPNQTIQSGGAYQLFITQQGCTYGSNIPSITFDSDRCPQKACAFKVEFKLISKIPGGLRYHVTISNGSGVPQTIHLSSANGYGTFVPALHPIGTSITTFTVDFYVNSTYTPGIIDEFIISGKNCMTKTRIKLEETERRTQAFEIPSLSLTPNPTSSITTAAYNIGTSNENAQYLVVYDLLGVERYKQKISANQAEVILQIEHLAKGTYLISLEADGKRIATEKLIKK